MFGWSLSSAAFTAPVTREIWTAYFEIYRMISILFQHILVSSNHLQTVKSLFTVDTSPVSSCYRGVCWNYCLPGWNKYFIPARIILGHNGQCIYYLPTLRTPKGTAVSSEFCWVLTPLTTLCYWSVWHLISYHRYHRKHDWYDYILISFLINHYIWSESFALLSNYLGKLYSGAAVLFHFSLIAM